VGEAADYKSINHSGGTNRRRERSRGGEGEAQVDSL